LKIYVEDNKHLEYGNVEILCTKTELDLLVNALIKFQSEIDEYVENNKDKTDLGFTHMHYCDYDGICKKSGADMVFYVDLNKEL